MRAVQKGILTVGPEVMVLALVQAGMVPSAEPAECAIGVVSVIGWVEV
jgi:hypothetical protein